MSVYMVSGPILLVFGALATLIGASGGAFAFWRWRALGDGLFAGITLLLVLGGLSVTAAGFSPTVQERFTVSDTMYQSKVRNYLVWTTDGREISVPTEVGRTLDPGDGWTCRIHRVPVTHQLLGDCFDGGPA